MKTTILCIQHHLFLILIMDISLSIRELVIHNHQAGLNLSQISRTLHISRRSVKRIINLQETSGGIFSRRNNCGGHNRLSQRTERALARASRIDPRATAHQLAQSVGGPALEVDVSTIRRSLRRNGIHSFRPKKAPCLSPSQCRVRFLWAKSHENWSEADWARVVFSDETTIDICPPRTQYVHRRRDAHISQRHTASHRPFLKRVMFWGCISILGPGPLIPITGNLNGTKYIDIIEQHLLPHVEAWFGNDPFLYQQDNAPCHKAASVAQVLATHHITTLDWPPYSPDLNCIENMWSMLKRKLHVHQHVTRQNLIDRAMDMWENDEDIRKMCLSLIESMPRRIRECIASKGEYTHY